MHLKLTAIIQTIVLVCITSISFAEDKSKKKVPKRQDSYYYDQFQKVFKHIEKNYAQEPDLQEMTDEAINGMLRSLDPYSGYYTDEDLQFFIDHTDGKFGGIGVEITYDSGAVKVISPIDDLPAYKAGIKSGDYIIGVNGKLVSNMGFNKSVREMRGEPDTKLNLLILKEGANKPVELELVRKIVKIDPVKSELELDEFVSVGYIRIVTFNKQTISEVKKAVKSLTKKSKEQQKDLKGIILDLRNNPGGLLDQSVAVCEYFIDHGTIVSIRGRQKDNETIFSASRFTQKAPQIPMVVLINSGSASASEIVAGALQDHKRAIIMGTTSFGKGLVQTFTQINKRAGLKLTTTKYYTPNGRSINAKGIEPDIFIENAKVEYAKKEEKESNFTSSSVKEYLKKYNKEEDTDDTEKTDKRKMSDKYKEDYQYARAYDLISGLIISKEKK